jgi:hypothetical protein
VVTPLKSKAVLILRDKSGVSLLIVLAVMLLIMAIGVSVLVAAGASMGFVRSQQEYNRVRLLEESVHRSIMYELQRPTAGVSQGTLDTRLATRIAEAAYWIAEQGAAGDSRYLPATLPAFDPALTVRLDGAVPASGNVSLHSVDVAFSIQPGDFMTLSGPTPAQIWPVWVPSAAGTELLDPEDPDSEAGEWVWPTCDDTGLLLPQILRQPRIAALSANVTVTVVIAINAGEANETLVTSTAIYRYAGGALSDDRGGSLAALYPSPGAGANPMEFTSYGTWTLESFRRGGP